MLDRAIIIYSENHTKRIKILCEQNEEFFILKQVVRIVFTKWLIPFNVGSYSMYTLALHFLPVLEASIELWTHQQLLC
jgi:hypothetical protein